MKHLFSIPDEQSQELRKLSERTGLPMSFFVREALREFLAKDKLHPSMVVNGVRFSGSMLEVRVG